MKTAIILGATGLTGGILLQKLLEDQEYSEVNVISRTSVGFTNPKMKEHIIDLMELDNYSSLFRVDEVFCCIGSTQKKTPDEEKYRKVDYGIPVTAARLAKDKRVQKFLVVSALGADPESRFFYNRTKGEMERDVLSENLPQTYIFQPALIGGVRKEKRSFESLWKKVMKVGDYFLLGPLKKYRTIDPETIAAAMVEVAKHSYRKERIESDEIKEIVNRG